MKKRVEGEQDDTRVQGRLTKLKGHKVENEQPKTNVEEQRMYMGARTRDHVL